MNYSTGIRNTVSSHVLMKLLAENKTFAHFLVPFRNSDRPLSLKEKQNLVYLHDYEHLF